MQVLSYVVSFPVIVAPTRIDYTETKSNLQASSDKVPKNEAHHTCWIMLYIIHSINWY
jgi:hypothetical protein